ncbi:MAG TPA: GntR family transcriptional regulator [Roseiflexaceae bacterium]
MDIRTPIRGASLADQTLDILCRRIKSGFYAARAQLPPENQLAAEFNVSRATIRSAMTALAQQGLVVRRHGVGTFVSRLSRLSNPLNEAEDFGYMIAKSGALPGIRFVRVAIVQADTAVAAALQIEAGCTVLRSHKIFTADGEPVIYCINSIPTRILGDDLAREAAAHPEMIEPLFDLLEQRCNHRTEYQVAKLQPEVAQNCDFPDLPLDPNHPVLFLEDVGYNADELPLWHSLNYFPKSRMSFELVRYRTRGK